MLKANIYLLDLQFIKFNEVDFLLASFLITEPTVLEIMFLIVLLWLLKIGMFKDTLLNESITSLYFLFINLSELKIIQKSLNLLEVIHINL